MLNCQPSDATPLPPAAPPTIYRLQTPLRLVPLRPSNSAKDGTYGGAGAPPGKAGTVPNNEGLKTPGTICPELGSVVAAESENTNVVAAIGMFSPGLPTRKAPPLISGP